MNLLGVAERNWKEWNDGKHVFQRVKQSSHGHNANGEMRVVPTLYDYLLFQQN